MMGATCTTSPSMDLPVVVKPLDVGVSLLHCGCSVGDAWPPQNGQRFCISGPPKNPVKKHRPWNKSQQTILTSKKTHLGIQTLLLSFFLQRKNKKSRIPSLRPFARYRHLMQRHTSSPDRSSA